MIVVTGLVVIVLILSSNGWPQPGFFVSTTMTPVAVMKIEVFPPPPAASALRTKRLSACFSTLIAEADGFGGACCCAATAIESAPTISKPPRTIRLVIGCPPQGGSG